MPFHGHVVPFAWRGVLLYNASRDVLFHGVLHLLVKFHDKGDWDDLAGLVEYAVKLVLDFWVALHDDSADD